MLFAGLVGRREFRLLLKYLVYFNELWHKFEAIDTDSDRRLTRGPVRPPGLRGAHA